MRRDNSLEMMHFYLSAAFILLGFFLLLILAVNDTDVDLTGMVVFSGINHCEEGSALWDCSDSSLGNRCVLTRDGPQLRFSEKCYE